MSDELETSRRAHKASVANLTETIEMQRAALAARDDLLRRAERALVELRAAFLRLPFAEGVTKDDRDEAMSAIRQAEAVIQALPARGGEAERDPWVDALRWAISECNQGPLQWQDDTRGFLERLIEDREAERGEAGDGKGPEPGPRRGLDLIRSVDRDLRRARAERGEGE